MELKLVVWLSLRTNGNESVKEVENKRDKNYVRTFIVNCSVILCIRD